MAADDCDIPQRRNEIVCRLRDWLQETEGDGVLEENEQ